MNHRSRHYRVRILRGDIFVAALLVGVMIGAWARWPENVVADIAIPLALLIAFISWRRS